MTYREKLEKKCEVLYSSEGDIKKRLDILRDALWQASNSGYCDAMASREMSGIEDAQTRFWDKACSLKSEIGALCEIYEKEIGE